MPVAVAVESIGIPKIIEGSHSLAGIEVFVAQSPSSSMITLSATVVKHKALEKFCLVSRKVTKAKAAE